MSVFLSICAHPVHRRSLPSMAPRHTTAMDGGSAGNASLHGCNLLEQCRSNCRGAITCPYILYIAAPCHPWHRDIPYILYIAALCHPWHRDIPYILYICAPAPASLRYTAHPWASPLLAIHGTATYRTSCT